VNLVHLKNRSKGGGGGIIFTFSSTFWSCSQNPSNSVAYCQKKN
jgi:hypothetical protein